MLIYPIYLIDVTGSILMIVLSIFSLYYSKKLLTYQPDKFIWKYMFLISISLVTFAISRSLGHTFKFFLIILNKEYVWKELSPISGSINTTIFIVISTLTFMFYIIRNMIDRISDDSRRLAEINETLVKSQEDLQRLTQELEEKVEERTRQLAESKRKLQNFFEQSQDMIFFCIGSKIVDINPAGVNLLGFTEKGDVLGRDFCDFFHDKSLWDQFMQKLVLNRKVKDFEVEIINNQNDRISLVITSHMVEDHEEEIKFEGIARDQTRFKQIMARLMQTEKMVSIGQLAAGVAHEINTPLGIILGYTQLLKDDFKDNKEIYDILNIMEKQTKICKRIVSDLLKFSRKSDKKEFQETDINNCIEEVLSLVEHTLNLNKIQIKRELNYSLPKIYANDTKLHQVLLNIITNAHHAIESDGVILISTKQHNDDYIEINIADSGKGISPETMKRIFEPFYTTKSVGQGTGLGLSLSLDIIKEHNGNILVQSPISDSEFLDKGLNTLFKIILPIKKG